MTGILSFYYYFIVYLFHFLLRTVPTFVAVHLEILVFPAWVVSINTSIFLRVSKLCRESKTSQVLLVSKRKIGGNHAFFRDNKASI